MQAREDQIERIDIESFCKERQADKPGQYFVERNKLTDECKLVLVNDIANSLDDERIVEKIGFNDFLKKYEVKNKVFAQAAKTRRQQVSIWQNPPKRQSDERQPDDSDMKTLGRYFIEFNKKTGEIRVILAQQFVASFNMSDLSAE